MSSRSGRKRPSAPSAWATDAQGHLLPAVLVYDHGWLSFFPESRAGSSHGYPRQRQQPVGK